MKWQDAEARLAAKNATVIRAALRQSIDPAKVWALYQDTHPVSTDNQTFDRAKARAWAMLNVHTDDEPLSSALRTLYAQTWVLGEQAADEMLAAHAVEKAAKPRLKPVDSWDTWTAGDAAAEALLRPKKGLRTLLEAAGVTIKGIKRTTYERIGTALADAVAAGLGDRAAARLVRDHISDPARALMIAVTEQNRAVSAATVSRYTEMGVERMSWLASDPCPTCSMNAGKIVEMGQTFPSGVTQPPAHPYCRCALLPVLDEGEPDHVAGSVEQLPSETSKPVVQGINGKRTGQTRTVDAERLHRVTTEYGAGWETEDGWLIIGGVPMTDGTTSYEIYAPSTPTDPDWYSLHDRNAGSAGGLRNAVNDLLFYRNRLAKVRA